MHIGISTRQFSAEEMVRIANNYSILNIAKFHAQWDSARQQEDARYIKNKNNSIKINVYYSSSLMFWMDKSTTSNDNFKKYYNRERAGFKDDWLLRDKKGNVIYLDDANTAFVDLSNAQYREWAIGVISHWKQNTPYDGVFFDNSRPLGDYGKITTTSTISGWNVDWNVLISTNKVSDYNLGLNQLFIESKRAFESIIYNGIGRRNYTPSRNTDLLEYSDGTMNEGFCMWRQDASDGTGKDYRLWAPEEMLNDIGIMLSSSGAPHNKTILQKVNHSGSTALYNSDQAAIINAKQIKRYCLGSFLLGHRPGYTFFKYGPDYGPRELSSDPKEIALDLGSPIDNKYAGVASDAYKREFENGIVYVNLSNDATAFISAPYPMTLMNGATETAQYDQGASVSVPPKDAFFFNWSHSALFLKNGSMGAWTSNVPFNNIVNDPMFGWQVFKSTDFIAYSAQYPSELANPARPIIINFSRAEDISDNGLDIRVEAIKKEMDALLANPAYKQKIRGVNWDWENDTGVSISTGLAASTLKKIYGYSHRRGLIFGITVQPGDISLSRVGIIDLAQVKSFSDFFMPMEYAQWFGGNACDKDAEGNFLTEQECFNRRKIRINKDLTKFSALRTSGVPVIVAANIKTLNSPIEKLSPCQIYDLYKNVLYSTFTPTVDGFAIWKLKELDKDYMTVFNSIKDGNPIKSSACPLPTVSLTAPTAGVSVSGSAVAVSADAADDVGVTGVQFKLDGANLGSEDKVAPYGVSWNTRSAAAGAHVLTAVARDAAGNASTSTAVSVTVDNTPPAISSAVATEITSNGASVGWTTSEPGDTQVEYGTSTAYGTMTTLNATPVTAHSQALSGLSAGTLYHFRARTRDAAGNLAVSEDQTLFLKSIGIWPGPAFKDNNPLINDLVFGWQVLGSSTFISYCGQYPSECSKTRPVMISYAPVARNDAYVLSTQTTTIKANIDSLLANNTYKQKISGITWDWEYSDTNAIDNVLASAVLKDVYEYAHSKGLLFGLTVQSGNRSLYNAGLVKGIYTNSTDMQEDLAKIKNYSDFFMPMEYAQWFGGDPGNSCLTDPNGPEACWNQRKIRINNDLAKFENMGIPVIALSTIKTTATEPVERLSACQMYDAYKNVLYSTYTATARGFAVWNPKYLNNYYMAVFNEINNSNPYKSSTCPVDNAAPVINSAAAAAISSSAASVGWTTNEPGDTQVEYGTSSAYATMYSSMTALNETLATAHSQVLSGLSASTLYHFRVRSYDAAGNLAVSEDSTFTTAAATDVTAPTMSLTTPTAGALVAGPAVAISAEAADDIGVTGVQFKLDGANLGLEDTAPPYGVNWNTRSVAAGVHVLAAVARDAAGNASTSTVVSVTVDNAPPIISAVAAAEVSSGAATISWITDEASSSRVEYGTSTAYGTMTALKTALVTAHSQALSGLSAGTLYHFRVRSRDAAGNLAVSADSTVTTVAEIKIGPQPNTALDIGFTIRDLYPAALASLETALSTLPAGDQVKIIAGTLASSQGIAIPSDVAAEFKIRGNESFWLHITQGSVEIVGASELGALHGLSTLERTVIKNNGKINAQSTIDGPQLKTRALHVVVAVKAYSDGNPNGYVSPEDVRGVIHQARLHNYNTLILMLTDRVKLDTYGGRSSSHYWSKEQFLEVIDYAQENGLEFIPNIDLLAKVSRFFNGVFPDKLLYNYDTYNPQKAEVYSHVRPIIDELAELHNSDYGILLKLKPIKAIHIGHDEVAGFNQKTKDELAAFNPPQVMLPPDLFLSDVETLYNYISNIKKLQTWMWGDMLVSKEEYPCMVGESGGGNGLHGSEYRDFNLFSRIPKGIVINDWHYNQISPMFPTALAFALKGHQVLGVTWTAKETIKNFTDYLANIPSPNAQGMIASVWAKGWEKIDEIISVSGDASWNAKKMKQPDFIFSISKPMDVVVKQGASVTDPITVTASNITNRQVLLYAANLPRDAYIHFLPTASTAQPSYQSEFTVTTSSSTPPGNYPVEIKAIVGENIQTAVFGLTVTYADTVPPAVSILTPAGGSKISGITRITGVASDNVAVSSVAVSIDGATYSLASGTASWTFSLNTAALALGAHTITARAVDTSGNAAVAAITVVVNNLDTTVPTIAITSPTTAPTYATASATIGFSGTASDNVGVASVAWSNAATGASGAAIGTTSWSLTGVSLVSGINAITVTAKDAANNISTDTITVTYTATGSLAPVITSALTSTGTVGTALSYQITATNSPTNFNAAGLPAGLSVSTGGLISGTPSTIGTSSVTISATNAGGTGSAGLALSVYSACDVNRDGSTNVVDVQLQVNQALGAAACTSDLNGDGACNVIDVQRIVNTSLGGQCILNP